MPKVLTFEKLGRMMYLRSIGFSQEEIGKEIGVTQEAISYNLRKIKERATEEGTLTPFFMLLAGAADAGLGNFAEYLFGKQARLFPCPECGKPIAYKSSTCFWCSAHLTNKDWVESENFKEKEEREKI